MNLITFTFHVDKDKEEDYITESEELKKFWDEHNIIVSLFRDTSVKEKFYQLFLTERSVEELTVLIQAEESAKRSFDLIKQAGGSVVVSSFKQIF